MEAESRPPTTRGKSVARSIVLLLIVSLFGNGTLFYLKLQTEERLYQTELTLSAHEQALASSSIRVALLNDSLTESIDTTTELRDELDGERERNDDFEDQIKEITGAVGTLDKLSKIDEELLQKYSKVYFLNENYQPEQTRRIDEDFLAPNTELEYVHKEVRPFLEELLNEAKDDGISLAVSSGYRSFDEQYALKGKYTVEYGEGANTFSADQGFSEHQLGTAIDFSTEETDFIIDAFGGTKAFAWLQKNAYKYGFILSYPEGNEYYIYEPWHWRFVGEKLARDLNRSGKNFYDLEQREIDEYLVELFD